MASLTDSATMSKDQAFIDRVTSAVSTTAYNILTGDGTEEDHARREALARLVVQNVSAAGLQFTPMVVANPTIAANAPDQAAVPDNDILFVVNLIWIDFAPPAPPEAPGAVTP